MRLYKSKQQLDFFCFLYFVMFSRAISHRVVQGNFENLASSDLPAPASWGAGIVTPTVYMLLYNNQHMP